MKTYSVIPVHAGIQNSSVDGVLNPGMRRDDGGTAQPMQLTTSTILTLADIDKAALQALLGHYGMMLEVVAANDDIPGSFWGDSEAGLIDNRLLARSETPLSTQYCMRPVITSAWTPTVVADYTPMLAVIMTKRTVFVICRYCSPHSW